MPPPPIPVLDGHNDVLLVLEEAARRGSVPSFTTGDDVLEVDLPSARAGGFAGGFFACFVPEELGADHDLADAVVKTDEGWEIPYAPTVGHAHAREVAFALARRLAAVASESDGAVRIARGVRDLDDAVNGGPLAAVLHLEGAEPIDPDTLAELDELAPAGLRSVGLVWSRANAFATGVPFRYPASPDVGPGLTEAGRRLVRACNERGLMIDLAHLNEAGFWDVAELSEAPLVASHTGAHAVCPTARNVTDAQIDAIGASGGLVGVIANTADLRGDRSGGSGASIDDVVAHIEHVAGRIGRDHVAFGSDWNGAVPPAGLETCAELPALLGALGTAGWSEAEVRSFAHGNWLRVLAETWR